MDFWKEECPSRGGALTHAHWSQCDPEDVHPHDSTGNEGNKHPWLMCCHCQMTSFMVAEAASASAARRAGVPHLYKFTITGRCAECQQTESAHLKELSKPEGGCTVDHRSITTALLVGDDGLQWKTCPMCGYQVEPKLAQGLPTGPSYGPGRMPFTQRHWDKIATMKAAFEAGYYTS